MGWLKDKLFKKTPKGSKYADVLNGFTPIYSQFGTDIYASDVVQQAINCIVSELKKLNPQHIKKSDSGDIQPVNSSLQRVLNAPNPIMTTSDFLEKTIWQLFLNYNAFIVPFYTRYFDEKGVEQRTYRELYPLNPQAVEFLEYENGIFVKFTFSNGYETTIPYDDVIHIRLRYSVNDYMGGNEFGQPDNDSLLKTLDLNDKLLKNLSKAMSSSCAVNGVVKFKSMIDGGKTEKALADLEQKLKNSESGFLPLDIGADFTPITRDIQFVDAETLEFIDSKILRHFGVPLCILTGDYTKSQYEAFYQKTLEPIIISLSQAFTKTLFTQRERSFNNQIKFYPKELIFMSTDQTLEMIRLLGDSGSLYENEKRTAFGLRPLPELSGKRTQSLNYVDVSIANQYQMQGGENSNGES